MLNFKLPSIQYICGTISGRNIDQSGHDKLMYMKIICNFVYKMTTFPIEFQVTGFCRSPQETRKSSPTGSMTSSVSNAMLTPSRQLTDAEKLRKVILELVDTERAYVKVILIFIFAVFIFFSSPPHISHNSIPVQGTFIISHIHIHIHCQIELGRNA